MPSPDQPEPDKRLELAYDAIQEKLKMQDATLASTRTRANNLLATTALFVSFSAGVGLISNDPDKGSALCPGVAAVLLLVVVALGVSVLIVAWPTKKWIYVPHASIIMQMTDAGESVSMCGFRRCLAVPLQDILDGFGRCRIWVY
jgi:hypothetical protein